MYVQSSLFSICVISSAFLPVNSADFKRLDISENDGYDITSHVTGTRWPRSVHSIGGSVVRALLKGTKQVETRSTVYRKYLKQGTAFDAISDFNSLNFKIRTNKNYGAIGIKGHTKVKLTLKDKTNHWLPTIGIRNPNMDKSVKIVYMNKQID